MIAQGNALGMRHVLSKSPERASQSAPGIPFIRTEIVATQDCHAPSGLLRYGGPIPRALPWADMLLPLWGEA